MDNHESCSDVKNGLVNSTRITIGLIYSCFFSGHIVETAMV